MTEVKIDPQAAFDRVSSWSDKVGTAFNTVSAAFSAMSDLSLGGDGFSANAVGFVNGVRGVQSKVQAVARASTDADLGGMSSYDMVQAAIASALEQKEADEAERAALIEKAEKYGSSFPPPDEYDSPKEIPVEDLEEINQFLQENEDDDEVMAAFYGALPAENLLAYTANLPSVQSKDAKYLPGTGDDVSKAQAEFLRLIGGTMGEGSRKGFLPPSYADDLVNAALENHSWQRPDWALSEILQTGDYSADFLNTLGDGLWEYEDQNDPTHSWGWRFDSPGMKVVGYNDELNPDPIKSVLDAMHRSSESHDALQSFVYPPGGDSRAAKLVDRYWGEEVGDFDRVAKTFEVLAIPEGSAPEDIERAAKAATDAVQLLPRHFADAGASTESRGSVANILTFYWADVDALARTDDGTDTPKDNKYLDSMGLQVSQVEFTRDDVAFALGEVMDLDDFDESNDAIGDSPSARIIAAMAEFNNYRNEMAQPDGGDPVFREDGRNALTDSLNSLGFVTEAGFQDEIQDGKDRDEQMEFMRTFTVTAISTAASMGASSIVGPAGASAGKVAGAAASWGSKTLAEEWWGEPNSAARVTTDVCNTSASLVEATEAAWAVSFWDSEIDGGKQIERGSVSIVDADGNVITDPSELHDAIERVKDAFVVDAGTVNSNFDAGRKRANPHESQINLENCG